MAIILALSVRRGFVVVACLGAIAAVAASSWADPAPPQERRVVFGHSVEGEPLVAERIGDPSSDRRVLVVGEIHGDEGEGREVVKSLRRRYEGIEGVELWTVLTINPDGHDAEQRKNARGVDLNRNFSVDWSGAEPLSSGYYAGPRPFSEPESRAVRRLVERIRPAISIWYHQPWGVVLAPESGSSAIHRRYARIARMPLQTFAETGSLPGTAIEWQAEKLDRGTHFVVELFAGELSEAKARRHARAVAAVAVGG